MSNNQNIRYGIITLNGWVQDPATNAIRVFHQATDAQPYMKPGDQIIPFKSKEILAEYQSGKRKDPSVNRFGRGSNRVPGQPRSV